MTIPVNKENLTFLIEGVAACGGSDAGVTRLSFTPEYRAAADFLKRYMTDIGLSVREDGMGTLFGRLEGTDPAAPAVLSGSHLDSVRQGGKYDGIAGIVCAVEALRAIRESGLTHTHPLEVVVMNEEEGCRFSDGMISSRAMLGKFTETDLSQRDVDGVTMREAMTQYGASGDYRSCARGDLAAFVELHIEQGPVLERSGCDIGVVSSIVALHGLELTVRGFAGHAGTTPMAGRRDPMVALAGIIARATKEVEALGGGEVLTFGQVSTLPGSPNVIPFAARATVDARADCMEKVEHILALLREACREVCAMNGTLCELTDLYRKENVVLDERIRAMIARHAQEAGFSAMSLPSGAGHDSQIMADHMPTAMIFIPNTDGRSHCKEEHASPERLHKGACVLAQTLYELAK